MGSFRFCAQGFATVGDVAERHHAVALSHGVARPGVVDGACEAAGLDGVVNVQW